MSNGTTYGINIFVLLLCHTSEDQNHQQHPGLRMSHEEFIYIAPQLKERVQRGRFNQIPLQSNQIPLTKGVFSLSINYF